MAYRHTLSKNDIKCMQKTNTRLRIWRSGGGQANKQKMVYSMYVYLFILLFIIIIIQMRIFMCGYA